MFFGVSLSPGGRWKPEVVQSAASQSVLARTFKLCSELLRGNLIDHFLPKDRSFLPSRWFHSFIYFFSFCGAATSGRERHSSAAKPADGFSCNWQRVQVERESGKGKKKLDKTAKTTARTREKSDCGRHLTSRLVFVKYRDKKLGGLDRSLANCCLCYMLALWVAEETAR